MGLLTLQEFLDLRNPQGKHHDSDSYEITVARFNDTFHPVGHRQQSKGHEYLYLQALDGPDGSYVILRDDRPAAVIHDGTLYLSSLISQSEVPLHFSEGNRHVEIHIDQVRRVKYPAEYQKLVSDVAAKNRERYSVVLQHLVVAGEALELRAARKPEKDKGISLVILNSRSEVVAMASDEWGATLIRVAQEYQRRGLGRILGRFWYEWNPSYSSGGFTPQGENNAARLWESRVREFIAFGWYSELVRKGRLTRGRLHDILRGLSAKARRESPFPPEPTVKPKAEIRVYAEDDAFVVYDARFLTTQDEDFIHAYGFFRDAPRVGTFLYTIDYDRPFQARATAIALQMARDMHEPVYVGEGYGDMLELDGVPSVEREGDHVSLTRDILPLRDMARLERMLRRRDDPYDEMKVLLLEAAESKW